jgi:hypothetical protein
MIRNDMGPFKIGPIGIPEKSVRKQPKLLNIPGHLTLEGGTDR